MSSSPSPVTTFGGNPEETLRFNMNFSTPGESGPVQSLLLAAQQMCSTDDMAAELDSKDSVHAASINGPTETTPTLLPNGKKTKGRVKIKMEYIGNKLRRYTTFSKRKTGIMKKASILLMYFRSP
jgi:hypothetical protein